MPPPRPMPPTPPSRASCRRSASTSTRSSCARPPPCSMLLTPGWADSGKTGIELIQQTLTGQLGTWTNAFMSVTVLFFAFSSIIGNYFYGEINMDFISRHPAALWIYRAFVVMMVYLGSVASLGLVWNLADLFMALMAIVNLVAIAILGKYAFIALDDYVSQKKRGILNPEFDPSVMPNHRGILCWPRHKEEEIEQC
ncbi:MAG: alanine:cation symporter family protein [Sutterella wadsworthensis]